MILYMTFALYKFQELLFLLNRPTRRAESKANIPYLFITTKRAIHRHVCCTRLWRNSLFEAESKAEEESVSEKGYISDISDYISQ